jgi:hypothetical protein
MPTMRPFSEYGACPDCGTTQTPGGPLTIAMRRVRARENDPLTMRRECASCHHSWTESLERFVLPSVEAAEE